MAGMVRIEVVPEGVVEILKSQAVQDRLAQAGEAIASAANAAAGLDDGFEVVRGTGGKTRTRVFVQTASAEGMRAEATNRALSKSLDAGRG